jgi:hypothetical protein
VRRVFTPVFVDIAAPPGYLYSSGGHDACEYLTHGWIIYSRASSIRRFATPTGVTIDPDKLDLPDWMDLEKARRIASLRALGYRQAEIARKVKVSQQTVSRYLKKIQDAAKKGGDDEAFFAGLILGGIGAALLYKLLQKRK